MTKKLILSVLAILFIGCKGYQHTAAPVFQPVFEKTNQLAVALSPNHYHVGYSATDNLFVFSSGFYRNARNPNIFRDKGKEGSGGVTRTERSSELNIGLGYLLGTVRKSQFIIMAGGGAGTIDFDYKEEFRPPYISSLNAGKFNFFIQPGVNWLFNDYVKLSLSSKFTGINFTSISAMAEPGKVMVVYNEDASFMNKKRAFVLFAEPALSLKTGKKVKFETQIIRPIKLDGADLRYRRISINFGVFFTLF